MAYLVLLFLDLASVPQARGDDALYRQAMADHHLTGYYDFPNVFDQCAHVAKNASDLGDLVAPFLAANQMPFVGRKVNVHFSRIGYSGNRAWLQLTTSDATSCLLYQRKGGSYRLVREIRLPQ